MLTSKQIIAAMKMRQTYGDNDGACFGTLDASRLRPAFPRSSLPSEKYFEDGKERIRVIEEEDEKTGEPLLYTFLSKDIQIRENYGITIIYCKTDSERELIQEHYKDKFFPIQDPETFQDKTNNLVYIIEEFF